MHSRRSLLIHYQTSQIIKSSYLAISSSSSLCSEKEEIWSEIGSSLCSEKEEIWSEIQQTCISRHFVMSWLFSRTFKSRNKIFFCETFKNNYAKALSEPFKGLQYALMP